jgi:hypothetical protein
VPIQWNDLEIRDASEEEFASIPPRKAGSGPDPRIAAVLDEIASGAIKEIRVPDESQMRGLRVTLGRAASQRGFRLEYRAEGPVMYVRKSDEPLKPGTSSQPTTHGNGAKKRGRPRKVAEPTE